MTTAIRTLSLLAAGILLAGLPSHAQTPATSPAGPDSLNIPAQAATAIQLADTIKPTPLWTTGGGAGLNFSQVKLSNWAGGGLSSISLGSQLKFDAKYAKGPVIWENKMLAAFGLIRQGDEEADKFRKTDDALQLQSQYNYNLSERFFITALADFRTQMAAGHEFKEENGETRRILISEFLAPGFLLTSVGATYKKPDRFTLIASPVTGKFTFVQNDSLSQAGAFGVEAGEKFRSEFGASLVSSYQKDIFTNVRFTTNLSLFGNYETLSRIDVNWEGTLLLKVNRYINSTVSAQLIYDHDILQKTQFRNVINVGFLYQWPNKL